MSPALRASEYQDDFSAGQFRDVAPHLIPDDGMYDLVNGFLAEDGSPQRRGGSRYLTTNGLGTSGLTFLWDGQTLGGQRTLAANTADFAVKVPSAGTEVLNPIAGSAGMPFPKQTAYVGSTLFIGGGYIYGGSRSQTFSQSINVTNGSRTVTAGGGTWLADGRDAGMMLQVGLGSTRLYPVRSIETNTSLTLEDPYEGATAGSVAATVWAIYTITDADPYVASDFYTVCQNRLVWARGSRVFFSPLDPITKIPKVHSTPDPNDYHELPEGVEVVGLASIGAICLIFTTGGIWTLHGLAFDIVDANGNPQHRLEILSRELILFDAAGIASTQQTLIAPCTDGVYLLDGVSQPQRISKPIDRLYRYYVDAGYKTGQAAVFRGHYLLPIIDAASNVADQLVCRLDRPIESRSQRSFPWTRNDGDGGELTALAVHSSSGARAPKLYGAQKRGTSRLVDCTAFFQPDTAFKSDADGSVHVFDLITRDYGDGTHNVFRAIRARYELVDAADDNPTVSIFRSDGSLTSGVARWDEVTWDDFEWADDVGAIFTSLDCTGGESEGHDPLRCRVNVPARYQRFRITTNGPAASFALRSIEVIQRPSAAAGRR